jgi:hypothetical protein
MWVEVEELTRRLDEADCSGGDAGTVDGGLEVELQGSPGTASELAQAPASYSYQYFVFSAHDVFG